jgi:hypothetical protein
MTRGSWISIARRTMASTVLVALGALSALGCAVDASEEDDGIDPTSSADAIVARTVSCSSKLVSDNLLFPDSVDTNTIVTLRYVSSGNTVVFTDMTFASAKHGRYAVSFRSSARPEDGDLLEEGFYTYYRGEDRDYLREDVATRHVELSAPRGARITIRTQRDIPYARDSHGSCTFTVPRA